MWQTRVLAVYIAATVPVEKAGDVNPLLESAKKIGVKDDDENETVADRSPKENSNGSFERFMTSFGSPARWAGR